MPISSEKKFKDELIQWANDHGGDLGVVKTQTPISNDQKALLHKLIQLKMPDRKDSVYRYTNVASLLRLPSSAMPWSPAPMTEDIYYLRFVDGILFDSHLPDSIMIEAAEQTNNDSQDFFVILNQLFVNQNYRLSISPDTDLSEQPILIQHFVEATSASNRLMIDCQHNSKVTVIEDYQISSDAHYNQSTEIRLADESQLEHIQCQQGQGSLIQNVLINQAQHAEYNQFFLRSATSVLHQNTHCKLVGVNAQATIRGLSMAKGKDQINSHITIEHLADHTTSNQYFKGVADDQSQISFGGGIFIPSGLKGISAHQLNKNLLLSKDAFINTQPNLQIHSDDVRCTHGASIGAIDQQALFYLQSRGLSRDAATKLLTQAFINEILDEIELPEAQALIQR